MAAIRKPYFTVFIPVYNGGKTIFRTIQSVLNQNFTDYELIIQDNQSTDNTLSIIKSFEDKRLKLFKNQTNLGYSGNLNAGIKNCHGTIIVLLAADDILANNTLSRYHQAFNLHPQVGAITRPYYWFTNDFRIPIRVKDQLDPTQDTVVSFSDEFSKIKIVFSTLDQLSGLAMKQKLIDIPFSQEPWISHAYPFVSIFTKHPILFLKNFTVAVDASTSLTRSNIYQRSPMIYWIDMLNTTITDPSQQTIKSQLIKEFISTNYIGLIQIKNFGSILSLYREIFYLVKFRPLNIFNLKFWMITIFTILTPRKISIFLTDWYKNTINSRLISPISFPYQATSSPPPTSLAKTKNNFLPTKPK